MAGGRPTKYHPDFPALLIEHMSTGKSFETFAAKLFKERSLLICRDTLYGWVDKYPEFLYAKSVGWILSQDYWEEIIATNVHTPAGQWSQTACLFILKCRFGYRDGQEIDVKKINQNSEKLDNVSKQLASLISIKAGKKNVSKTNAESLSTSGDDHQGTATNSEDHGPDPKRDEEK